MNENEAWIVGIDLAVEDAGEREASAKSLESLRKETMLQVRMAHVLGCVADGILELKEGRPLGARVAMEMAIAAGLGDYDARILSRGRSTWRGIRRGSRTTWPSGWRR